MPRTGDDVLETIDLFYRAAMEPDLWPEALGSLAEAVGCVGTALIPISPSDTISGLIVSPSLEEVAVDYRRDWWRVDTRVGRIFDLKLARGVFAEAQLFTQEELARDPFRQEFCTAHGIGVFASQLVEPWPGHVIAFSVQRGLEHGHFESGEIETLDRLGRHAARALTISARLASHERAARGFMDVLDRFDGGVFLLDGRNEVVLANSAAERMLGDGLAMVGRRLLTSALERQSALDALIASTSNVLLTAADIRPVALPRPSGRKPLIAQALPMRRSRREVPGDGFEGVLLLVIDPDGPAHSTHDCLRLLGLTAAEARLAALVGTGMRRHDAASMLGVSDWTAHTTLKHIYSKLNIASQGELVRLVGRIAAAEPRPGNGD